MKNKDFSGNYVLRNQVTGEVYQILDMCSVGCDVVNDRGDHKYISRGEIVPDYDPT